MTAMQVEGYVPGKKSLGAKFVQILIIYKNVFVNHVCVCIFLNTSSSITKYIFYLHQFMFCALFFFSKKKCILLVRIRNCISHL